MGVALRVGGDDCRMFCRRPWLQCIRGREPTFDVYDGDYCVAAPYEFYVR